MAFTPDFVAYRIYDTDAGEAASTPLAAEDTAASVDTSGGNVDVQFRPLVDNQGVDPGASTDDYQLEYSLNGGSWTAVSSSSSVIKTPGSSPSHGLTNGFATTNRATNGITDPGGTSFQAGSQILFFGGPLNYQLGASSFTEFAIGLTVVAADVSNGDTIDLRFTAASGGGSITNSITARINISIAAAGGGQSLMLLGVS